MIVTCKNCGTKFNVDEKLIPPSGRKVKCSKCSNIFSIQPPPPADKIVEEEEVFHLTEDELESKEKPQKTTDDIRDDKELDEEFDGIEDELEQIAKKYQKPAGAKKRRDKKRSKLPFLITMAMLIIAIFVGSVFIILKTKNRVPPFKFSNLSAQYYENSKYEKVLVIKGTLINNRNTAWTKVKLKASIYNSSGEKIKDTFTYVGNVFNKEEILNLTPEYVKKFIFDNIVIKPLGEQPFMIFLFDLPKAAYSYQVVVESYEKSKKRGR